MRVDELKIPDAQRSPLHNTYKYIQYVAHELYSMNINNSKNTYFPKHHNQRSVSNNELNKSLSDGWTRTQRCTWTSKQAESSDQDCYPFLFCFMHMCGVIYVYGSAKGDHKIFEL